MPRAGRGRAPPRCASACWSCSTRSGSTGCTPSGTWTRWSASAQAERMARRVEEDPEGGAGLMLVLGRAELDHRGLRGVEVVDDHVQMSLLRHLLARPLRRG